MPYFMTMEDAAQYGAYLRGAERSEATVRKYLHALADFQRFAAGGPVTKETALAYKREISGRFSTSTVNGIITALNGFFEYREWPLRLRLLKKQRRVFTEREEELTREEYLRLVTTARSLGDTRLCLLLQTVCATGIRISELQFVTVEAARLRRAQVNCKGKRRTVLIPKPLCAALLHYAESRNIRTGPVFVTRSGNPMDRSNIWSAMKRLCLAADVEPQKVYPHNLRHLFARTFYDAEKDIAKLADLLGHASIDTTRIYLMESGESHEQLLSRLGLLEL